MLSGGEFSGAELVRSFQRRSESEIMPEVYEIVLNVEGEVRSAAAKPRKVYPGDDRILRTGVPPGPTREWIVGDSEKQFSATPVDALRTFLTCAARNLRCESTPVLKAPTALTHCGLHICIQPFPNSEVSEQSPSARAFISNPSRRHSHRKRQTSQVSSATV